MCRLCLATYTDQGIPKADLIHELMLRACHDEAGQKDGWGVTDMHTTWRSPNWYFDEVPRWKRGIREDGFILSHLRKASGGTGRTIVDNHPYVFKPSTGTLIAAHNGFFAGTTYKWEQGQPNTDSHRALTRLAHMLEEYPNIDADLINEWLGLFNEDSHYAVMLHWKDNVHVLRGKTRTLAALEVGNGYLIHTNIAMLNMARVYLDTLYDIKCPVPEAIPDDTMLTLPLGSREVKIAALDPKHPKAYVSTPAWSSVPPPKTSAVSIVNKSAGTGDDEESNGAIIAPSVTPPRVSRTLAATDFTQKERRREWIRIAGKLSPLRNELSAMWCAQIMHYQTKEHPTDVSMFLTRASRRELLLLEGVLVPSDPETGQVIKPFSPVACAMINWWNHHVKAGFDMEVHDRFFKSGVFWLDVTYTQMHDLTGKHNNISYVMNVWIQYMLRNIAQLDNNEIRRFFDVDTLTRTIRTYSASKSFSPVVVDMKGTAAA